MQQSIICVGNNLKVEEKINSGWQFPIKKPSKKAPIYKIKCTL